MSYYHKPQPSNATIVHITQTAPFQFHTLAQQKPPKSVTMGTFGSKHDAYEPGLPPRINHPAYNEYAQQQYVQEQQRPKKKDKKKKAGIAAELIGVSA